ncbi:hypothetical protein [Leucobacter komagatae]|uniref:hypothetical protein n=1 Tax=Leucobacter komagatae TaxID=55969 RepID=UPI001B85D492|nr:hypothetical protein [Leucobacter komagatae]
MAPLAFAGGATGIWGAAAAVVAAAAAVVAAAAAVVAAAAAAAATALRVPGPTSAPAARPRLPARGPLPPPHPLK